MMRIQTLRRMTLSGFLALLCCDGLVASSQLIHGQAAADWEKLTISEPLPYTGGGSTIDDGYNFIVWYIYNDGRQGVGTTSASDTGSGSYTGRHESSKTFVESWVYHGDKSGHLEGQANLDAVGDLTLATTSGGSGAAGGQAVSAATYKSTSAGGPFSAISEGAAAETVAGSMVTFSFSAGPFSASWSSVISSNGWGNYTDVGSNIVPETICTNSWTFWSTIDIGVQAYANAIDPLYYGWIVTVDGVTTAAVTGTVTLSELNPEDCP